MNGLKKLKIAIVVLLILTILSIVGIIMISNIEEDNTLDAYESLSYDDQMTVRHFYNKLTDYTGLYTIFGYMYYAVGAGLFILISKLWNMNKI